MRWEREGECREVGDTVSLLPIIIPSNTQRNQHHNITSDTILPPSSFGNLFCKAMCTFVPHDNVVQWKFVSRVWPIASRFQTEPVLGMTCHSETESELGLMSQMCWVTMFGVSRVPNTLHWMGSQQPRVLDGGRSVVNLLSLVFFAAYCQWHNIILTEWLHSTDIRAPSYFSDFWWYDGWSEQTNIHWCQ